MINKLKKKMNNQGSSIVMVIVSLAFIGIIVGALLSAAGAAYRLKLQETNAKDNFYYVEQAMQEVYNGVGMQTIEEMKTAYAYTLENMVYYDIETNAYASLSDEEASQLFKDKFMEQIMNSDYFKKGSVELAECLQGYITNDSVVLDVSKLSVERQADKIIIKNVTLCRTQDYNRSAAGGTYTQTVSADIVISEPDFELSFNSLNADYSTIFDFAMVADMGIEIKQAENKNLVINGNIYAAADYYNKDYNDKDALDKKAAQAGLTYKDGYDANKLTYNNGVVSNSDYEYSFGSVTSKQACELDNDGNPKKDGGNYVYIRETADNKVNGYVNEFATVSQGGLKLPALMDGEEQHSKYSGLYIDGSNVSIMTNNIIVPGTIAVMNGSNLNVYGKASAVDMPQIWTDDIVLGGASKKDDSKGYYVGSSANLRANVFVKDDTEINADGSTFALTGSYYGYGDGTSKDTREFTIVVDKSKFQISTLVGEDTVTYNRGHYNSSAIVVNGQNSTLDFSFLNNLYVAGRAYVELSRYGTTSTAADVKTTRYTYNPYMDNSTTDYVRDYKTGESISYKTSQLLYTVSNFDPVPAEIKLEYDAVVIPPSLKGNASFFGKYFPVDIFGDYLPVVRQEIRGRQYVFIDFNTAWDMIQKATESTNTDAKAAALTLTDSTTGYSSVDDYIMKYAIDYANEMSKDDASPLLSDITKIDDFTLGDIRYREEDEDIKKTNVYSSGAISVRKDNSFSMTVSDGAVNSLLSDAAFTNYASNMNSAKKVPDNIVQDAFDISNDLETEYNFMKWNLAHYKINDSEKQFVKDVVANFGESSITPINKYMIMDNLAKKPSNMTDFSVDEYKLSTAAVDYLLWASEDDVTVDVKGDVTGIIVTKGDVIFTNQVTSFTGMVISGGKIYVGENMTAINAAPATCREILRECMRTSNNQTVYFLNLFREYEGTATATTTPNPTEGPAIDSTVDLMKDIDSIGISDVISMENWMTNEGGAYGIAD